MMAFLLDSNVFIQAKNLHYGLDFCPAFWNWLKASNGTGSVFSIERVEQELAEGSDELSAWSAPLGATFFLKPDGLVLTALTKVSAWANGQSYEQAAISKFLGDADYFLVGHALAHNHTVVTHEVASPSTRKIKIPSACTALKVKCVTPFEMLRQAGAKFVRSFFPRGARERRTCPRRGGEP